MKSPTHWRMWTAGNHRRTSADILGAAHTDAVEAGRKLGVDAVLNGEVGNGPADCALRFG